MDLVKILENVPSGTELYSLVYGTVKFEKIQTGISYDYPIICRVNHIETVAFTKEGLLYSNHDGECVLFPSKECRDWSKFLPKDTVVVCFDTTPRSFSDI